MEDTGESFTKASFALNVQRFATSTSTTAATPDLSRLYGHLIIAKAPRRRARHGLLLPPKPGSRARLPRLQAEGETDPNRFDPTGYEITPVYGSAALDRTHKGRLVYRFAELPGKELLATETTLREEMRRKPLAPSASLAWFYSITPEEFYALYATADSVPLPELSPKRAAAWTAARTCAACGKTNPNRFPNRLTATERCCSDCWPAERRDDWIGRQRPIQLEQVAWARGVLADPNVVLVGMERHMPTLVGRRFVGVTRVRIESFDGEVLP